MKDSENKEYFGANSLNFILNPRIPFILIGYLSGIELLFHDKAIL